MNGALLALGTVAALTAAAARRGSAAWTPAYAVAEMDAGAWRLLPNPVWNVPEKPVNEVRFKYETYGPWGILTRLEGLAIDSRGRVYGMRSLQKPKEDGYVTRGTVSVGGRTLRAFTGSQLFERPDRSLVEVAVLHVIDPWRKIPRITGTKGSTARAPREVTITSEMYLRAAHALPRDPWTREGREAVEVHEDLIALTLWLTAVGGGARETNRILFTNLERKGNLFFYRLPDREGTIVMGGDDGVRIDRAGAEQILGRLRRTWPPIPRITGTKGSPSVRMKPGTSSDFHGSEWKMGPYTVWLTDNQDGYANFATLCWNDTKGRARDILLQTVLWNEGTYGKHIARERTKQGLSALARALPSRDRWEAVRVFERWVKRLEIPRISKGRDRDG